ncbi:hypothetical protein [Streptomyces huiliensis]|uniref:hypothetical protein n=1 Tax=Streptomyces huiliensis TaxID=2876027 RepID=UPI001CBD4E5E|nr:hypothetical protein [Streptomyces huiliensis]MBZ4318938.1 hypothetical protein [Streptomyces huiliensis]
MTTSSWYVFVEEDAKAWDRVEGVDLYLHRWQLVVSEHIDGGREAAEVRAEELASAHVPAYIARFLNPGGRPQRSVFRMVDGSWLVQVKLRWDETHFRVHVGRLTLTEEEIEGEEPSPPEKKRLKWIFRR